MSSAVRRTYEMVRKLEAQGKPWVEIQDEVEQARIKEGGFELQFAGCENAPYRLRLIPKRHPLRIISRKFDEKLSRIGREHSLQVQMRCTGYNVFMHTEAPDGLTQKIRRSLGLRYKRRLLHVLYLDKYGLELERPDLPGVVDAVEEIGRELYGVAA